MLERLRAATRAAHLRIEGAVRLLPEPTPARYRWFLAKQYGFHEPLEARWDACAGALDPELAAELGRRRRVPLLLQDLRALGVDAAGLPRCGSLPDVGNSARTLGVLYVVEGSTLGGQVLARAVEHALGIGPSHGAAFLRGYGPRTRERWDEVRRRLEGFGAAAPGAIPELVASAVDCFASMQRWLEGEGAAARRSA